MILGDAGEVIWLALVAGDLLDHLDEILARGLGKLHLEVDAAGSGEGRIEALRVVGGHDQNAAGGLENAVQNVEEV